MKDFIIRELQNQKIIVAENMVRFGGSFIKNIGEALFHADPINTIKIYTTFQKEWLHYLHFND